MTHTAEMPPRTRERMDRLLVEAEQMIIDQGFTALTMRKLAERCGIALGNLQYYFPSKSDLMAALVERIYDQHLRSPDTKTEFSENPETVFRKIIEYMLNDIRKAEGSVLYWELWALAAHDEMARDAMTKFYQAEQAWLAQGIKHLNPALPARLTTLRAKVIMGLIEGSTLLIGTGRPDARTPRPLMDEIITAALSIARQPA